MLSMVESMDAESNSIKKLASESEVENVGKRSRKFFLLVFPICLSRFLSRTRAFRFVVSILIVAFLISIKYVIFCITLTHILSFCSV